LPRVRPGPFARSGARTRLAWSMSLYGLPRAIAGRIRASFTVASDRRRMTDLNASLPLADLRVLARVKFQGGFGPIGQAEFAERIGALLDKGMLSLSDGVVTMTPEGDAEIERARVRSLCKTVEEWTPFETELWRVMKFGHDGPPMNREFLH
jgi:hypothetical protein